MKVFIGRFGHECNTMASSLTQYGDVLTSGGWCRGKSVIDTYRGTPEYLGGVIDCADSHGIELVPSVSMEVASPPLSTECLNTIMKQIMEDLNACKDSIDGICFVLHGAGCAEGIDDLEKYVLERFREAVGDDMPITVPLDLHGNISVEMTELANGLFGIKQYPHTDQAESGYLAMETLYDIITTGRRPKTAYARLPMLIAPACGYTLDEPFVTLNGYLADYCKANDLIDATLFHGFPYADVPCSSASVVTVAYEGAQEAADAIAAHIWAHREAFKVDYISPAQALDMARAHEGEGYILLNEASDNPGGGAPGDGTHLLREMIARDMPGSIFAFIYDPDAAKRITASGVGAKIDIAIGGKIEKLHGEPVELRGAEVLALSDGRTVSNSPMLMGVTREFGPSALLRTGNVEIIVASVQRQTLDDRLFDVLGVDITKRKVVAIKSTHHFRAFFKERAQRIIAVETPGVHCADLSSLEYKKLVRPIYPFDEGATL